MAPASTTERTELSCRKDSRKTRNLPAKPEGCKGCLSRHWRWREHKRLGSARLGSRLSGGFFTRAQARESLHAPLLRRRRARGRSHEFSRALQPRGRRSGRSSPPRHRGPSEETSDFALHSLHCMGCAGFRMGARDPDSVWHHLQNKHTTQTRIISVGLDAVSDGLASTASPWL